MSKRDSSYQEVDNDSRSKSDSKKRKFDKETFTLSAYVGFRPKYYASFWKRLSSAFRVLMGNGFVIFYQEDN